MPCVVAMRGCPHRCLSVAQAGRARGLASPSTSAPPHAPHPRVGSGTHAHTSRCLRKAALHCTATQQGTSSTPEKRWIVAVSAMSSSAACAVPSARPSRRGRRGQRVARASGDATTSRPCNPSRSRRVRLIVRQRLRGGTPDVARRCTSSRRPAVALLASGTVTLSSASVRVTSERCLHGHLLRG